MKLPRPPLIVIVLALLLDAARAAEEPAAPVAGTTKPQTKITISKETTYITKPLRPDGYPDYFAAINQRMSEGVTSENNAAVLLMKAAGPTIVPESIRNETLKRLGIDDLPKNGDYFVSQMEMIKRWRSSHLNDAQKSDDDLQKQFDEAQRRPWSEKEFPMVAEWLKINEKPLELARQAADKTKCYCPEVPEKGDEPLLASLLLPLSTKSRDIAELLIVHAMERVKQNDIDSAWRDLMCGHRLARLVAQGDYIVNLLLGYGIDTLVTKADVELAHSAKLNPRQALQMLDELRALPPMTDVSGKLDFSERCLTLDSMLYVARDGHMKVFLASLGIRSSKTDLNPPLGNVDWDAALKTFNDFSGRLVNVGKIIDPRQRRIAAGELSAETDELRKEINQFASTLLVEPSKKEAGLKMGKVFLLFCSADLIHCFNAEDRTKVQSLMDQTAFALAAYRVDKGQYPNSLDTLVPSYMASIPDDPFAPTPTPIRYQREGDAYKMWSVFLNGVDDDGHTEDDDPKGDDWVIRPVPKPK